MTQEKALSILKTGAPVFLTGEPGSGKTHTVNAYIKYLRERGIEPAITASTGIAATHIGGMTIHAWSGIGIRNSINEYDIDRIMQNERLVRRMRQTPILLIDEISMLSANTLSMVDTVCRAVRSSEKAFGGMQVVLIGDFFQLPPIVSRQNEEISIDYDGGEAATSPFAFGSPSWKALNPLVCYLTEQHRQEDSSFLEVLSAIRSGSVSEMHREALTSRMSQQDSGADTTHLFSHNADVDRINLDRLEKLGGRAHRYTMKTKGSPTLTASLVKNCLSPQALELKIGARVMFTKNDPQGRFVNGTTGVVTEFEQDGAPVIEMSNGNTITAIPVEWSVESDNRVLAQITQIPLRLAWAITVHKSQGISLDTATIDLSRTFEYGQGYVALSRVRTLSGLTLTGINARAYEVHPQISDQDSTFRELSNATEDAFEELGAKNIEEMQSAFIKALGGSTDKKITKQQVEDKKSTYELTKEALSSCSSLEHLAKKRSLKIATVLSHLERLSNNKSLKTTDIEHLLKLPERDISKIHEQFNSLGTGKLRPVYDALGEKYSFEDIRLARLTLPSKER